MANFYFTYRFTDCTHVWSASVNQNRVLSGPWATSRGNYTQNPITIPNFLTIINGTLSYNTGRDVSSGLTWNTTSSLQLRDVTDPDNPEVIHTSAGVGHATINLPSENIPSIISNRVYDINLSSSAGAYLNNQSKPGSYVYRAYFTDIHLTLECSLSVPNTILTASDLNQLAQILQVNQTLSNAGDAIIALTDAQAIGTGVSNMYTGWDALNQSSEASQNPVTHLSPVTFDSTKPLYADIQNVISAMTDNHVVTIIEHT